MRVVVIIQARMNSSRLPGKVLQSVLGKPLLEYEIERLQRITNIDELVVATTVDSKDNPVVELCERLKVPYFRGSENDVLERYYGAATKYQADVVVRVTADCPLIDPRVCEDTIRCYLDNYPTYDYVSNVIDRTFPRGFDTEVFSYQALCEAHHEAIRTADREHVTLFLYRQPECYHIGSFSNREDYSQHRWTVDTSEDLELITNIIQGLYPSKPDFDLTDTLKLLENHPEWQLINAHIEQKKI
jgi:spore coat polysaccharide biosynthesis protein SpsF